MIERSKQYSLVLLLGGLVACQPESADTDKPQKAGEPVQQQAEQAQQETQAVPANVLDLSHWNITLPIDADSDGKVDVIGVEELQTFSHPDFFFAEGDRVTFVAPNRAATTANSTNTRSELRQLVDPSAKSAKAPSNNFVLANHSEAERYGAIGGRLSARLQVNHVAVSAQQPSKPPAYSVVVGQIHAGKDEALMEQGDGFGWGNEPLKIYYKKWPSHDKGSVFWTYERNLPKDDPNRTDIAYPVWGNTWDNDAEPGENGIALGEQFSYTVNVDGNIMHLTFTSEGHDTVEYEIDLANNVNAYGEVDEKDHPLGYTGDWFYFKAGSYNQCSIQEKEGMWYPGCAGTGNWAEDQSQGHYASVSFYELDVE